MNRTAPIFSKNSAFEPPSDDISPQAVCNASCGRTSSSILQSLTIGITEKYSQINAEFHSPTVIPRRTLTRPCVGVRNGGYDNEDGDLICRIGDEIEDAVSGKVYIIVDALGKGSSGQTFRCDIKGSKRCVAVKIVKNSSLYNSQGHVERNIMKLLNKKIDPNDERNIIRIHDSFKFKNHHCIVMETLGFALIEAIECTHFEGLPLEIVRDFTKQILKAMEAMEEAQVIHCDLKPENILLSSTTTHASFKSFLDMVRALPPCTCTCASSDDASSGFVAAKFTTPTAPSSRIPSGQRLSDSMSSSCSQQSISPRSTITREFSGVDGLVTAAMHASTTDPSSPRRRSVLNELDMKTPKAYPHSDNPRDRNVPSNVNDRIDVDHALNRSLNHSRRSHSTHSTHRTIRAPPGPGPMDHNQKCRRCTALSELQYPQLKLIDFGSACFEGKAKYSYVQSRFYRSPEVLLGIPYNCAVDMWSLGCVCAEMFLGLPLFPGASSHDQITQIVNLLGMPPEYMIRGRHGKKHFCKETRPSSQSHSDSSAPVTCPFDMDMDMDLNRDMNMGMNMDVSYRLRTPEEYAMETGAAPIFGPRIFNQESLEDVIMNSAAGIAHATVSTTTCAVTGRNSLSSDIDKSLHSYQSHHSHYSYYSQISMNCVSIVSAGDSEDNSSTQNQAALDGKAKAIAAAEDELKCFLHFLRGLLQLDPLQRWTAEQAARHPFMTGSGTGSLLAVGGFCRPDSVRSLACTRLTHLDMELNETEANPNTTNNTNIDITADTEKGRFVARRMSVSEKLTVTPPLIQYSVPVPPAASQSSKELNSKSRTQRILSSLQSQTTRFTSQSSAFTAGRRLFQPMTPGNADSTTPSTTPKAPLTTSGREGGNVSGKSASSSGKSSASSLWLSVVGSLGIGSGKTEEITLRGHGNGEEPSAVSPRNAQIEGQDAVKDGFEKRQPARRLGGLVRRISKAVLPNLGTTPSKSS